MNLPEGRRGQATALAILVIVVIVVAEFVVSPLVGRYTRTNDEIFAMQRDIQRYRLLLNEGTALADFAARLRRDKPLAGVTLGGDNAALAAAELQQRLQRSAAENDVRLVSLRVLAADADDGPLDAIVLEARGLAQTSGLRGMLFDLETGSPYLFFKEMSIRSQGARRQRPGGNELDVRMEVYGLRAPGLVRGGEGS
jgi:general secretion pathway protein M